MPGLRGAAACRLVKASHKALPPPSRRDIAFTLPPAMEASVEGRLIKCRHWLQARCHLSRQSCFRIRSPGLRTTSASSCRSKRRVSSALPRCKAGQVRGGHVCDLAAPGPATHPGAGKLILPACLPRLPCPYRSTTSCWALARLVCCATRDHHLPPLLRRRRWQGRSGCPARWPTGAPHT